MGQIDRLRDSTKISNEILTASLVVSIYKLAVLKMPFLAWPVLSQLYKFLMSHSLSFLLEKGAIWFNVAWIRAEVSADAAGLEEARQKAMRAIAEGASDEDLDKADEEMRRAFDKLHRGGRGPF